MLTKELDHINKNPQPNEKVSEPYVCFTLLSIKILFVLSGHTNNYLFSCIDIKFYTQFYIVVNKKCSKSNYPKKPNETIAPVEKIKVLFQKKDSRVSGTFFCIYFKL